MRKRLVEVVELDKFFEVLVWLAAIFFIRVVLDRKLKPLAHDERERMSMMLRICWLPHSAVPSISFSAMAVTAELEKEIIGVFRDTFVFSRPPKTGMVHVVLKRRHCRRKLFLMTSGGLKNAQTFVTFISA
jgi:hypothetical protein